MKAHAKWTTWSRTELVTSQEEVLGRGNEVSDSILPIKAEVEIYYVVDETKCNTGYRAGL